MKKDGSVVDRDLRLERRAEVLRGYVAIEWPTAADSQQAADDLGISVQRLYGLAAAWRAHGTVQMKVGSARKEQAVDEAIEAAEGPLDLSAFRPDARLEVERRIRVIGRYLRTGTNDRATAEAHAEKFGTGYAAFRNAVTAWIIGREPTKLPGFKTMLSTPPVPRMIHPEVDRIITSTIADYGAAASVSSIHRRVVQLTKLAGHEPASLATIQNRVLAVRKGTNLNARDDVLCLDHVYVRTEGRQREGRRYGLTLLFGAASGRIYGHRMHGGPPSAAIDADLLAEHLRQPPSADRITLLEMHLPIGESWDELSDVLVEGGVETLMPGTRGLTSGRLARQTLGIWIGELEIRRIDERIATILKPDVIVPDEALAIVGSEVDRHNAGMASFVRTLATKSAPFEVADRLETLATSPVHAP